MPKPKKIKLRQFICMECLSTVYSSDKKTKICTFCKENPQASFERRMNNIVDLG